MPTIMDNTRTLPSGRVVYRRVYPAALRPFVPKQAREFKVTLGVEGDPELGTRHTDAIRRYDAILAEARARQSGSALPLTPAIAVKLGEWFRAEILEADEEARWDTTERELYETVAKQLTELGVPHTAGWEGHSNLRWSEKKAATVKHTLQAYKRYRATGDLEAIVDTWKDDAVELATARGFRASLSDHQALGTLCRAMNDAAIRAGEDQLRRLEGENVPTPEFPVLEEAEASGRLPSASLSLLTTFDSYAAAAGISPGVRSEWRKAVQRLIGFLGHDDARKLTSDDLRDWRDALLLETTPKQTLRTPRTVRNKYLTPVKAALTWAVDEQKLETNVASSVVVRVPKAAKLREKSYTSEEALKVLKAALVPSPPRTTARSALARRWVPWLCAYTGARVNEITQLRREDLKQQDGVWLLRITPEAGRVKTNEARLVPVHAHLIEQGFVQVVQQAEEGPLFYDGDRRRVGPEVESRQHKKIGERLAQWIRSDVGITDLAIKPNHAWRDTFKTLALEAGIQERVFDALQGHAASTVGQTYGHATIKTLAAAMDKFPRFEV